MKMTVKNTYAYGDRLVSYYYGDRLELLLR